MEWISISEKPKVNGYHWDGENFRDNTYLGHDRIVEASSCH